MRIRKPFAAAFLVLCAISALAGFSPSTYSLPTVHQSDKALHFIAFFLVTTAFYWVVETSRRKVLQLTFAVCTLGLGVVSEVIQSLLPINRSFDPFDVLANLLGSLASIALCTWYHKRMLERKRAARGYGAVAGDEFDERDLELGEGIGEQESGVERPTIVVESETWDEGAGDWGEVTEQTAAEGAANGQQGVKSTESGGDDGDGSGKKRND
ncbi:uncharacterized protein EI97DRAFT_499861 [Westerdykella ornata]|uniref:VanZ-like domain-containing protein n=1 Tax=Westerdykella ornata TaxID=318751 RepID=A0A6A6JQP2_WESOR|nr:uncharacterized protein EI97DRAFT_499861 [Westerdykella ornata]KAF2278423.1 hypothetical protein EI97DRAFT_499861 [Westerdykella ornata]